MKSRKVKAHAKNTRFKLKEQGKSQKSKDDYPDLEALCEDSNNEYSSDEEMPVDESSEEEVLPISGGESEDDDDEKQDENDGLPNRGAWGRKKSVYYNADFVDEDRGRTYREEDAEMAKAEVEEALAIQRSVMSYVKALDIDRTLLLKEAAEQQAEDEEEKDQKSTSLTKQEKLRRLKKTSPEFFTYDKEFKEKMTEIADKWEPLQKSVDDGTIPSGNFAIYIKEQYEITYQYCLNIVCYMSLKSSGSLYPNHSVHHWIKTFKAHLEALDEKYKIQKGDIDKVMQKISNNEEISFETIQATKSTKNMDNRIDNFNENENEDTDMMPEETTVDGKRTVTYQIAKNKGLVPRRKKEYRNPRVHHRMKYRKAKIRRKGQVREAVKEIKRYQGEATGISTHVVKSIKFK